MSRRGALAVAGAALTASWFRLGRRYRRDQAAAWRRLETVDRQTLHLPFGPVEYAVRGGGLPLLVSHGIFHGFDGALLSVRDIVPDRRVIAPSRFGYLGSALPAAATPGDQADVFAALLDHLGVDAAPALGISAGATAALQFALRHPDRVTHLIVLSGNLPGGGTAVAQPRWARALYADAPLWAITTLAPPLMARLAGVPAGLPRSDADDRLLAEMLDSFFPVAPRADGIAFDAFVSNVAVNDCPLERLTVPTLLLHASDDPLASYAAAERAAVRIPGAVLATLPSGGHMGLGQTERISAEIRGFLRTPANVEHRVGDPVR